MHPCGAIPPTRGALEIDLTEVGGERYFFCNEQNEKGEPVTGRGDNIQPYPIQGGFLN
ncbi:hypothetical protein [Escherichia coli]|uniref:hypothetical protein n=1 Tax=Escherichia coli TaxID=562 RepID=UPI00388EC2D3